MEALDAELIAEFKTEAEEHLGHVEPALLEMESCDAGRRQELVNQIFRAVHSVKGAAGFFDLDRIQNLAHAMENLLMPVRDGQLAFAPALTEPLLRGLDKLQALIAALPEVAELEISAEVEAVRAAANGAVAAGGTRAPAPSASPSAAPQPAATVPPASAAVISAALPAEPFELTPVLIEEVRRFGQKLYEIRIPAERSSDATGVTKLRDAVAALGELLYESPAADGRRWIARSVLEPALFAAELQLPVECLAELALPARPGAGDPEPDESAKPAAPAVAAEPPRAAAASARTPVATRSADAPAPAAPAAPAREADTIRVNVRLLDKLMNLAGELVLSRNQLRRNLGGRTDSATAAVLQDLDLITSEMQGGIMNTRMQPVGVVFNKFTRIVRDLAKKLGKDVELSLEGSEVELDKSIIELLSDPLTHLVRNALDHGFELPDERERAGKPQRGRLSLRAFHQGGQVQIEIADDGKGIDPVKMRKAALEKGVISRDEVDALSDRDAILLIFKPGFSTAKQVTEVSGRGVGMDVVNANISKLGGKIDVESKVGAGTRVRIRLPLTLAIIPSLIVDVAEERFAIPQVNLVELVRVKPSELALRISEVRGAEVMRLRGNLLPLVRLADVLGIPRERTAVGRAEAAGQARALPIAVLHLGEAHFGLVVDGVSDSEEIVVKPLSRLLDRCHIYAGATIMGDGRVAMILDAAGIAAEAQLELPEAALAAQEVRCAVDRGRLRNIVLFTNASDEQFAVELSQISRLEKIERSAIERVGGSEWMQHRGAGLPLLRLESHLPVGSLAEGAEEIFVLIPRSAGRPCGILASRVLDTVETQVQLERSASDSDLLAGRAVVEGRLTLFIDVGALAARESSRAA